MLFLRLPITSEYKKLLKLVKDCKEYDQDNIYWIENIIEEYLEHPDYDLLSNLSSICNSYYKDKLLNDVRFLSSIIIEERWNKHKSKDLAEYVDDIAESLDEKTKLLLKQKRDKRQELPF